MFTISLRSRSRNEIFISNFKGFVLLLPTQTFFYFMPIQLKYLNLVDKEEFLTISPNDNEIAFEIECYDEEYEEMIKNIILLTKSDVKHLIKELTLLVEIPDKIYTKIK